MSSFYMTRFFVTQFSAMSDNETFSQKIWQLLPLIESIAFFQIIPLKNSHHSNQNLLKSCLNNELAPIK